MARIGTFSNPTDWKRRMLKGVEPTCDSSPVLYSEPHKRRMRYPHDVVQPRGFVEDVSVDSLKAFEPKATNEAEARTFVALANHQHLRRSKTRVLEAELEYRASLRAFNICGNCMHPIRVKRETFKHGVEVSKLTDNTAEYADIPAHYEVFSKPAGKRFKYFYQLIEKTRIFNQKCGCGPLVRA